MRVFSILCLVWLAAPLAFAGRIDAIDPEIVTAYPATNGDMDWTAAGEEASHCANESWSAQEVYLAGIVLLRTGKGNEGLVCIDNALLNRASRTAIETTRLQLLRAFIRLYQAKIEDQSEKIIRFDRVDEAGGGA